MSLMLGACLSLTACSDGKDTDPEDSITEAESETDTETETDTEAETESTAKSEPVNYVIKNNSDKINIIGRCPVTDLGLISGWSASGFEMKVKGEGDVTVGALSTTKNADYLVFVDGEEHSTVTVPTSATKLTLGLDLDGEEHIIGFYRITNNEKSLKAATTIFVSVLFNGELCEYESGKKLIEFVGDSITCGSGLYNNGDFSGTLAYSFTLAQKLGCEHSMVATSGIGVYIGTTRHQNAGANMSKYYDLTNYLWSSTDRYIAKKKADLVVINLNTNDNDHGGNNNETEYKAAVNTLIQKVRDVHGDDVKILWVVGMMRSADSNVNNWMKEVLTGLGGEANGLYVTTVTQNNEGAGTHPDLEANGVVADELAAYIKSKGLI